MLKNVAGVVVCLGLLAGNAHADGVVCNSEGYIGAIDGLDYANAIEVVGDIAYVADRKEGLKIFDVSDPSAMVLLGSLDTAGTARDVLFEDSLISGKVVYVADSENGVLIIGVSDPSNPVQIASIATTGSAEGLSYHGGFGDGPYLTIAAGTQGVIVFDVSFPFSPLFKDSHTTADYAHDVTTDVVGGTHYLYVADGQTGLEMYRLLFGFAITPRLTTNTPSSARSVEVVGDIAYVADFSSGLQIIDLKADRFDPEIVGSFNTSGLAVDVQVSGGTAYIADGRGGVQVIDVRVPASPVGLGVVDVPEAAIALDVVGQDVYVAAADFGILSFDSGELDGLVSSSLLGVYSFGDVQTFGGDFIVDGDIAYVLRDGLHLFDVSGDTPVLLNTYGLGMSFGNMHFHGGTLYLINGAGLEILDVRVPTNLVLLGTHAMSVQPFGVFVDGNVGDGIFAYIAGGTSGMHIVDVTDSSAAFDVGVYSGGLVTEVGVADTSFGKVAYINDENDFVIVSLADQTQPLFFGSYGTGRFVKDIVIDGNTAYVISSSNSGEGRLDILDIRLPLNLALLASIEIDGRNFELDMAGSSLFISERSFGFLMYDMADPMSPRFVSAYDKEREINRGLYSLRVQDDIGYVRSDGFFSTLDMSECTTCPADLNGDGVLNFFDVGDFLVAYGAENSAADFDQNGEFNFFDVGDFLTAYAAGCP